MKNRIQTITLFLMCALNGMSQPYWRSNGSLNNGSSGNNLGTFNNYPINIYTSGIHRALFTTGNALYSWSGNYGDGLRILPPPGTFGSLDLFTSNTNGGSETHIKFGGSGQVSGQNNRFEFIATGATFGCYYSTFSGSGIHRFDRGTTEYGRLGTNNFWRFGENTSGSTNGGLNATRQVEIVDNAAQLRLTYSPNSSGPYTDFFSNTNGNMLVQPSGTRVGINLFSNPSATLDVDGDVRIRNVQAANPNSILVGVNANGSSDVNVRRLDFNNNPNTYLGGDGQFHTINNTPPFNNVFANNGLTFYNVNFFGINLRLIQLGQNISQPGNPAQLISDREIPMNDFNLNFNGLGTQGKNKISIGMPIPSQSSKLSVYNDLEQYGTLSVTNRNGGNAVQYAGVAGGIINYISDFASGVYGLAQNNNPAYAPYALGNGVYGKAQGNAVNVGVRGLANASNFTISNYAGFFDATGNTPTLNKGIYVNSGGSSGGTYGAQIVANNGGDYTYGIHVLAQSMYNTGATYGIFSQVFGVNPTKFAGYFDGDVFTTSNQYYTSDLNLKVNIDSSSLHGLDLINHLKPVKFKYADYSQSNNLHLAQGQQIGFIAQEVEQVLPNAVKNIVHPATLDSLGNVVKPGMNIKGLNYRVFIPIAIQGIKELNKKVDSLQQNQPQNTDSLQAQIDSLVAQNTAQQTQIDDLNNRLTQLENCLGNLLPLLCQINQSAMQQNSEETQRQLSQVINVTLSDDENIVLNQNAPNPFAESAVITYSIPASVQNAQIIFYDKYGKLMKKVTVTERGAGRLNVYGSDLSSGTYSYTLVADGKVIATKFMVKM